MKTRLFGTGIILLTAPAIIFSGCIMTQDKLEDDIRVNRVSAYEKWRNETEKGSEDMVRIDRVLGVDQCVIIALKYNREVQAILKEKQKAEGIIKEAWAGALPKLDFAVNYRRLDEVASFEVEGQSVSLGSEDNYSAEFTLKQPLYKGGVVSAGLRAAKLFAYLADERVKKVVQDTIYSVRQQYYRILLLKELVGVSSQALELSKAHLEDVKLKKNQGIASEFDVLRVHVEVSNFEAEMIQEQNILHLAKASLLKNLGISQESRIELRGKLEYEQIHRSPFAEAVEEAFQNRPELIQSELEVKLRKEAVVAAKSGWYPEIEAFFSEKYASPEPHTATDIEWGNAWFAGVTATISIFDGFQTAGKVKQEKAALEQSKIQLKNTEEQVLLDIKQAFFNLEDAVEFVESQSANIKRANEGLRLVETGYKEGVNTEIEVLDARQALSQTQALYYRAVHKHVIAKLDMEKATGRLVPPAEKVGSEK